VSNAKVNRIIVPLAALSAATLIATWFPYSTLLSQSAQLDATSQQISTIHRESQQLSVEHKLLSSKQAIELLAREQYQLVAPGQRLIQVLNNNSTAGSSRTGDPADQPLVAPSDASGLLPTDPSVPATPRHTTSFWSRVTRTLEFWR
jgi:cell division protein FtsB